MSLKNEEILYLLKQKNAAGIELLYDKYGSIVYGLLSQLTSDSSTAEYLMKEVYIYVWDSTHELEIGKEDDLLSWLLSKTLETIQHQIKIGKLNDSNFTSINKAGYKTSDNLLPFWNRLENHTADGLYDFPNENTAEERLKYAVLAIRAKLKINESIFQG